MFKKTAAALSFSLALGVAGGAQADTFLFNPLGTGAGGALTATSFDWLQGNVLAIGGGGVTPGGTVGDLFQANLDSVVNGSTNVFSNGDSGAFFTVVAGFTERVTNVFLDPVNGTATATFDDLLVPNPGATFFRICSQTAVATDLTGAGFACDAAHAILTGQLALNGILGTTTTVTDINFAAPGGPTPASSLLDQFNADNWSGQLSANSTGAANIVVTITGVNTGYFPGLNIGTQLITAISNTSFITPFNQQNPSFCFSSNGTTSCNVNAVGTLGTINGNPFVTPSGSTNFIFQADANTTIRAVTIPEPATLALFGLGLAAVSLTLRRRGQKQ